MRRMRLSGVKDIACAIILCFLVLIVSVKIGLLVNAAYNKAMVVLTK